MSSANIWIVCNNIFASVTLPKNHKSQKLRKTVKTPSQTIFEIQFV